MHRTATKKKNISKRTSGYTPRRAFSFVGLGFQLAKTPFRMLRKRERPIGGG
jgi:hypothetical protein